LPKRNPGLEFANAFSVIHRELGKMLGSMIVNSTPFLLLAALAVSDL
jgi:hypothetical protein